jgi:hypothetical protein
MKRNDVKSLLSDSLTPESGSGDSYNLLKENGVTYSFDPRFTDRVIDIIFSQALVVNRQLEFVRTLNNVFYKVAFAGVAAILLLLMSIFITDGSLTFNSLMGISDSFDENLITLLAGE